MSLSRRAKCFRPRMIGRQQQIAAQQLVRLALDRPLDPIGEETDTGQRRHRQHQSQREDSQLAGAQVAQQHA